MEKMIEEIRNEFAPMWELNDRGHRESHFKNVLDTGLFINRELTLGYDEKLIALVAYFHDLFSWSRNNHHLLSAEWVRTTDHKLFASLSVVEREMVAQACAEHRASYKGEYSSGFSELMAAADRGMPNVDPKDLLERAIKFRLDRLGISREEAYPEALAHVVEKYGRGGYARRPALYMRAFASRMEGLYKGIEALASK